PISGSGGLVKDSGGMLSISGTNTFAGDTIIKAGVLAIQGWGSIASKKIIVNQGAVLDGVKADQGGISFGNGQTLSGMGLINGNLTMTSGATLLSSIASGTPIFNNSVALSSGSRCLFEVRKVPTTNTTVQVGGNVTYGGLLVLSNVTANPFQIGDSF